MLSTYKRTNTFSIAIMVSGISLLAMIAILFHNVFHGLIFNYLLVILASCIAVLVYSLPSVRLISRCCRPLQRKKPLTLDEVMERLRIDNKEVINTAYSIYYDLIKSEEKRRTDLDGKAYSLTATTGVFITLTFGLGSSFLRNICEPQWLVVMTYFYLATFIFGVLSWFYSVRASRARSDFRAINEEDVFNKDIIGKDENEYRRFLTAHMWQVYRNNFEVNEKKGEMLKSGFVMFVIAIIFLFIEVIVVSKYILFKGGV